MPGRPISRPCSYSLDGEALVAAPSAATQLPENQLKFDAFLEIDPGRIKRGLLPLAESGKILEAGKHYTLAIDREWQDGRGAALVEAYRKEVVAVPSRREKGPKK
jgi:hypothetical protein